MSSGKDLYDKTEMIAACAKHAWEGHEQEFIRRGVENEERLRQEIARTIEHPDTQAFRAQPQIRAGVPTHALCREIYDLRPFNEANPKYSITVVLNPNRHPEHGRIHGGTCYIQRRDDFKRLHRDERKQTGIDAEIVTGGRPALREQERHRQLVDSETVKPPKKQHSQTKTHDHDRATPNPNAYRSNAQSDSVKGSNNDEAARRRAFFRQRERSQEQVQERQPSRFVNVAPQPVQAPTQPESAPAMPAPAPVSSPAPAIDYEKAARERESTAEQQRREQFSRQMEQQRPSQAIERNINREP